MPGPLSRTRQHKGVRLAFGLCDHQAAFGRVGHGVLDQVPQHVVQLGRVRHHRARVGRQLHRDL
jgi:hypothetical protein